MRRSLALAVAGAALLLAPPASAVVRHASPTGANAGGCTSAEPPCSLRWAVETVASSGDEVILAPGLYSLSSPVTVSDVINLHGAANQPRPRVVSSAAMALDVAASGALVADLQLEAPGSVVDAGGNTVLERLIVLAGPGPNGFAVTLSDGGVLRDSFVHTVAANGRAVYALRRYPRLVNVTAIATDAGGIAVEADPVVGGICVPPFSTEVDVMNSIFRGGLYDISVPDRCNGGIQLVVAAASNYRPAKVQQALPEARLADAGGNQEVDPIFAAPASLDFHQLAGSPTIDAGVGGVRLSSMDIDGQARTLGARPDIGADEFVPPDPPPPPPPTPDLRAPVASLLAVTPNALRAPGRRASRAQRRRSGARISYALDEDATVTFAFRRAVRRRGRTRFVALPGALSHAGAVGGNRLRFSGRLGGRALKRGRYRLVAIPRDAAGNAGRAVTATFRVVR